MGGGGPCRGRSGAGGLLDFLRFQEMLWEEEEAQDGEGEEGRPPQKGEGRRGRERREGMSLLLRPTLKSSELLRVPGPALFWGFTFQEGEVKKEGGEEEKEQEKLGKLEYSLDYNFTEAQVRGHFSERASTAVNVTKASVSRS